MNVVVVQNSTTGPAGYFGRYLETRCGARLRIVRPPDLPAYDDVADAELIVVLGSSSGVYDPLPWIARERAFVRAALAARHPLVGICFGAQIIASALGAEVSPGTTYRGWIENDDVRDATWRGPWLRWHGDRLAAPAGAEVVARSAGTVMAFQIDRAIGLQFHPEADASILTDWLRIASPAARDGLDVPALTAESETRFQTSGPARERLFDELLARTTGRSTAGKRTAHVSDR